VNSFLDPNKDSAEHKIMRLVLPDFEAKDWITATGLDSVPPGFRGFSRVNERGNLEIGIEPTGSDHTKSDKFAAMTLAELQTECAKAGVKIDRTESVMTLRGKLRKSDK
jgi:hypothetical protein